MPDAHEIIDELGKVYQVKIVSMGYSPNLKQKEKWEYQQEFRVVLEKDNWEPKFTILGIGDITDISEVVLAEKLESVLQQF